MGYMAPAKFGEKTGFKRQVHLQTDTNILLGTEDWNFLKETCRKNSWSKSSVIAGLIHAFKENPRFWIREGYGVIERPVR